MNDTNKTALWRVLFVSALLAKVRCTGRMVAVRDASELALFGRLAR